MSAANLHGARAKTKMCGKPVSLLVTRSIPDWLCLGGRGQLGLEGYGAFGNHADFKGCYRILRRHREGAFPCAGFRLMESAGNRLEFSVRKHLYREGGGNLPPGVVSQAFPR